jgi:hypothetical protein
LALDSQVPVRSLQRLAYAASRAGHSQFLLVVGREEAPGQLGAIPFTLALSKPAEAVHIRVGVLGFRVEAPGSDAARVPRTASGALDTRALGRHLDGVTGSKNAVLYPLGEMTVGQIAILLTAIQRGENERLPNIALSVR